MKIIHLIFSFQTGGIETMLIDLMNYQVIDNDVYLIIINDSVNEDLIQKIDKSISISFINRRVGSRNIVSILKLNVLLFQIKADVIHIHNHNAINCLFPSFYKKTVLTVHDTGIHTNNLLKYKLIISISKAVYLDLFKRYGIKSEIILNGVEIDKIKRKTNLRDKREPFKIVQVSRLMHQKKGQHIVLEALSLLKDKGYNIKLDFIGDGKSKEYLENIVNINKLNDEVVFLGDQSRDLIYDSLCNYDLLIQPSYYEGFGLTIVEGLAAGLDVIASNIEGPKEILFSLNVGELFDVGNAKSCFGKIEKIILKSSHENVSIDKLKEFYDISRMVKDYSLQYKRIQ